MSHFRYETIWQANPGPQTMLIECPVEEVFYGGARGGGKTEGSIGDWLEHSNTYGEHAIGVFFRRTFKQLDEVIARTKQLFDKLGARYFELPKGEWIMPGGARLKFRYLERDSDAEEYQGHSYTRIYIEELTNFPSPRPINLLRATLRSGVGVPCCMRLTGNPGGPGHHWVKKRYIDPAPQGLKILTESFTDSDTGETITRERVFIPSKVSDNPKVGALYKGNLHQAAMGDPMLLRAWLNGDWDIIQGAYFECWDSKIHVVPPDTYRFIPPNAQRLRSLDWGTARPFSVGWYAIGDGKWRHPDLRTPFPEGAFVKYREWYGSNGQPDCGLRMNPESVARGILTRQQLAGEQIEYGVADPSIFINSTGISIAETMAKQACFWRRGDNKRIPGWVEFRHRLLGSQWQDSALVPMLYFAANCEDSIRTIPILQHDESNIEDVDTESEDHAADETRYAIMSRPMPSFAEEEKLQSADIRDLTINQLVERQTRLRKQSENSYY